jgi:FkbM family methyltransferase
VENKALGSEEGFIEIPNRNYDRKIPCTTLDKYFSKIPVDILKIDVDGAEIDIFKGGKRFLRKN